MNNKTRLTGTMEGTEGVLDDISGFAPLTDDALENVTGGVVHAPCPNAVGTSVYAYYDNRWWPGVIVAATAGDPALYTVQGYNSNGTQWSLVCTHGELRTRY